MLNLAMQSDRIAHKRDRTRIRVNRWRRIQRAHRHNPIAYAPYVSYDGAVLGKLIAKGYITEADATDPAKVSAALARMLSDWAYE